MLKNKLIKMIDYCYEQALNNKVPVIVDRNEPSEDVLRRQLQEISSIKKHVFALFKEPEAVSNNKQTATIALFNKNTFKLTERSISAKELELITDLDDILDVGLVQLLGAIYVESSAEELIIYKYDDSLIDLASYHSSIARYLTQYTLID